MSEFELPSNFNNTLGAAFCGFAVSCMLYGVLTNQTYNYFQQFPLDKTAYKVLVVSLWIMETVHQAFVGHFYYWYGISNFLNPFALLIPEWSVISQVMLGAVIAVIVKSCFAMRVWRFSNQNKPLTIFIMALNTAELGLAIAFTIKAFGLTTFLELPSLKLLTNLTLAIGALTDLVIAVALCYFLIRIRTGYSGTDSPVNSLIRYAVNTGALTTACSLSCLITYNTMPDNFIFISFYVVLSKLYCNALLATLNTRKTVGGKGTDAEQGTTRPYSLAQSLRDAHKMDQFTPTPSRSRFHTQLSVEVGVHQEVSVVSDPVETSKYSPYSPYSPRTAYAQ